MGWTDAFHAMGDRTVGLGRNKSKLTWNTLGGDACWMDGGSDISTPTASALSLQYI